MSTKNHLLDVRPRKTLIESFFVERMRSSTRFLIAEPEDLGTLLNYIEDASLDKRSVESLKESLQQSLVIMVTDCFEVCGLIVGSVQNNDEKILCIGLLHVCKDYQNANIETNLLKELFKLAQKAEINWAITTDPQTIEFCEQLKQSNKLAFNGPSNKKQVVINLKEQKEFLKHEQPFLPDAYLLSNAKRRVLGQYPAKALGRPLEYVIAIPEDEEVVKAFLTNEYFRQTAITRTLQCTKSDGQELITRFKPEVLQQGMVFMAHDRGRVCGLAVNKFIKVDHSGPKLDEEIPDDFTEEIDKQELTHLGAKSIRAICAWMDRLTPQMLPDDCNEYYLLDMLTVQPSYRGCKIGWKLWYESIKHMRELGYKYSQTICTAIASNRLATNFGFQRVIEFPYIQLKYKGKRLFEDGTVYDGGKHVCLYIGKVDELTLDS